MGAASVRIVSAAGVVATVAARSVLTEGASGRTVYAVTWDTWAADDGPCQFEANVADADGLTAAGTALRRLYVDNGAPALTVESPSDGTVVDTTVVVSASFTSHVPVAGLEAGLQPSSAAAAVLAPVDVEFGEDRLSGRFRLSLDASALDDGGATVVLVATDVRGRRSTTGIPVVVEHRR